MDFLAPAALPRIPTYRVMSDDGALEDPNRDEPDVTDEQVLTWYKNMLTGSYPRLFDTPKL
jgi:2-oxoisovalerate dehydrogenase E1 component alpha subunit